jgi:tRNA A-37 threonylcarbamoyl transferase component Bud32
MSGDESGPPNEQLTSWLAACDEALAAGSPPPAAEPAGVTPEGLARQQRGLALLRLLRQGLPPPGPPPEVPGYEILGELGRGGMGVVYKARHVRLSRLVALKMILAGGHATAEARARFRTEAEAAARLQHPNVVQIFDVGEHQGLPYLALEFCPGGSLADRLDGIPLSPPQAAALVQTLARAVHAAHRAGIVHRDMKPANVLLDADGTPKITDFGLAKKLDESAGPTRSGTLLGTPNYMAPEQTGTTLAPELPVARGKAVGPAADVYALGAMLYELLTGRPPFRGSTPVDTVLQLLTCEPVPPRTLNPGVDRGLEGICLKCLEKDPQHRYRSALALADDLANWRADEPILARPRPWGRSVWRVVRRPAVRNTAVGLLGGLVLALAVVALVMTLRPTPEAVRAKEQQQRWAAIQGDLAAGRPITLIGETGPPAHFSWRAGGPTAGTGQADDGTFSAHCLEHGLLELVAAPAQERYRFRAEVRHDQGPNLPEGEVGIYFAHSEQATAGVPAHCFATVALNDLWEQRGAFPEGGFQGNALGLKLYQQPPTGLRRDSALVGELQYPFDFPAPGARPWRRLAVEMTPQRVRVSCGDRRIIDRPRAELAEQFRTMTRSDPAPLAGEPAFAPWEGLGLYVSQGGASFRSVVVERPVQED